MRLKTRLTERLGIEHPILLAPMSVIAGGRLAAAVSNAGGLGMFTNSRAKQKSRLLSKPAFEIRALVQRNSEKIPKFCASLRSRWLVRSTGGGLM